MKQSALGSVFSQAVTRGRRWLRYVALSALLAACGGALGGAKAGGESHFLKRCEERCGSGLDCISGICTQGCVVGEDASCQKLAPSATCTAESVEPGAVAVCDVSCGRNRDCASLGAGFLCEGGFCRGPALSSEGSAGASAGTGPNGSGGSAPSSTGTAGSAGSSSPPVRCDRTDSHACEGVCYGNTCDGLCIDDPSDGCDGRENVTCPGICHEIFFSHSSCGGDLPDQPCPQGFSCTVDPREAGNMICVEDSQLGACARGDTCADGFSCVTGVGDCAPDRVDCAAPVTCKAAEQECPYGYARSRVGLSGAVADCYGPCVPLERCSCSRDAECPTGAACFAENGDTCVSTEPWHPPSKCSLPFEDGTCNDSRRVFVFEDGNCMEKAFHGCDDTQGNANRFSSKEECMLVCGGQPFANQCPDSWGAICLECGLTGGCTRRFNVCIQSCNEDADCVTPGMTCVDHSCSAICL